MKNIGRNDIDPYENVKKNEHGSLILNNVQSSLFSAGEVSVYKLFQSAIEHHQCGRFSEATALYQQILRLEPNNADALNLLGLVCHQQGNNDVAVEFITRAIAIKPDNESYHNYLGAALQAKGRLEEAIASYRQALALKPDYAEVFHNLGLALQAQDRQVEAIASYQQAVELKPDYIAVHLYLGFALQAQGRLNEAVASYRQILAIQPNYARIYHNLLFLLAYQAMLPPDKYLLQACGWEQSCVSALDRQNAANKTFQHPPLSGRKLKIGYVSADYNHHPVSYFLKKIFACHDRSRIELFAYSNNVTQDAITQEFMTLADHWISLADLDDATAAARIEADDIDILIDLSGHTGHNRLGIFALRAAPVQVHYLGYFASTGLSEMDYLIGDDIWTPPETDNHYSEHVWRLPRICHSYEGKTDAPTPEWLPDPDGIIRLGSFNNLDKLTPPTLALWAKILHALPESNLLLKNRELSDVGIRQRIFNVMASHGIPSCRIELHDSRITPEWSSHMAFYNRLDIVLDPICGLGGVTTTSDALWMGVPVITLMGDRMASRMTASMLHAIDHPEWVARSGADYIGKVVRLARNVELRKDLRTDQRRRMAASPLCDARGLTIELEKAYFAMYERWLNQKNVHNNLSIDQLFQAAIEHHQCGRFHQAETLYQQILSLEPAQADALNLLGLACHQQGKNEIAVELISRAITINPNTESYYSHLGAALQAQGMVDEAIASYRQALVIKPDYAEAYNNLGLVLHTQGKLDEAVKCLRQAISLEPDDAEFYNNLGLVLHTQGQQYEAIASYHQALAIKPDYAEAYGNLGLVLHTQGLLNEARASYRQALAIKPDYVEAYNNLGLVLHSQGLLEQAIICYRKAISIKPDYVEAFSNLLYLHSFSRDISPEIECRLATDWEKSVLDENERRAASDRQLSFHDLSHFNSRYGRKLRLGFVSAELGQHCVAEFLEPFLEQVDHSRFHITLYPTLTCPGPRAERLQILADDFKSLVKLSDKQAAELIRNDQIDILIDTTAHMRGGRLGVFAHRCAPVQCHYIGYHGTTGLTEMDWFIGDAELLPSICDSHFSEGIWRLPRLWLSYRGDTSLPNSKWQPAPDGTIRLGTFNNLLKIREETIELWARVMNVIPEAKLLLKNLKYGDLAAQKQIATELGRHGIGDERIEFIGWTPEWHEHMALYDRLDIALDTIPLNSGTTAFDALWMGVPLVALEGDWMGGRMTSTMLKALEKTEWVAKDKEEYLKIVTALAGDVAGRKSIRTSQRATMLASPLCDAMDLARAVECAFEAMFDQWRTGAKIDPGAGKKR